MSKHKAFKQANFYVDSRYVVKEVLGRGSYGVVCRAIDTKAQGPQPTKLAIKKVCKILTKEVLLRRAIRELRILRFLRGHRNVREFLNQRIGVFC